MQPTARSFREATGASGGVNGHMFRTTQPRETHDTNDSNH